MFDNETINNTLTSTVSSLPIANLTEEETSPMVFMIRKLWYQMFLSTLISSLLMHSIGAVILYVRLRTHKYAKWLALLIQIAGLTTPILICSVSNALIAVILVFTQLYDIHILAIISIGFGQSVAVVAVEFLRVIQTL